MRLLASIAARTTLVAGWVASAIVMVGCDQQPSSSAGSSNRDKRLVVTGSSTVAPLVLEIAKKFESLHPGMRVDVQSGGSSRGIADTRKGLADLGMVSRDLDHSEKDLMPYPIALDGICMIVHADNPATSLTQEQVVDIYTGRLDNWIDVRGEDMPITVIHKAEGRSTLEVFLEYFGLTSDEIRADVIIGENLQGIKTIAGNPGGIGYVSIGTALAEAESGTSIKLLPLDGVMPSFETVRSGQYPLLRKLNLISKPQPPDVTKRFIEFAQSNDVDQLVRELHFVPTR